VKDVGARGDGAADDTEALQRALDRKGLVVVPFGAYRTGPLRIGSGTHLRVHPQAKIVFADGAGRGELDFLLTNADRAEGNAEIVVEGGIWDGNNAANPRGPDSAGSYTGVMIDFVGVTGLTLRGMTLVDPESYYSRYSRVRRFLIEDIDLRMRRPRPNQDGVHVGGFCEDGIIRRIRAAGEATPTDDVVPLVADDALHRAQNIGKLRGPIRRIHVSDVRADDCHSFVRLLSIDHEIEDVVVDGVRGGARVCAVNMDGCRKCAVKVFDPADPKYAAGVGMVRNVRLTDFRVHRSTAAATNPLIDVLERVESFVVERFARDETRDANLGVPTLHVGMIRATRVTLEGISAAQLDAARARSTGRLEGAWRMAPVADEERCRAAFVADMTAAVTLPRGGFDRLALSPSPVGGV